MQNLLEFINKYEEKLTRDEIEAAEEIEKKRETVLTVLESINISLDKLMSATYYTGQKHALGQFKLEIEGQEKL